MKMTAHPTTNRVLAVLMALLAALPGTARSDQCAALFVQMRDSHGNPRLLVADQSGSEMCDVRPIPARAYTAADVTLRNQPNCRRIRVTYTDSSVESLCLGSSAPLKQ